MHNSTKCVKGRTTTSIVFVYIGLFQFWIISNVVVITIVKSSGIAVISSTQFLMTSKHKIGPKFTQQGRIDFISNFIKFSLNLLKICLRKYSKKWVLLINTKVYTQFWIQNKCILNISFREKFLCIIIRHLHFALFLNLSILKGIPKEYVIFFWASN